MKKFESEKEIERINPKLCVRSGRLRVEQSR